MLKKPTKEEWIKALEKRHGVELQKKFSDATVAVCGLGGLGAFMACFLARVGIGKLILIDFDRVDLENLHRQGYYFSQIGMYKTEALSEILRKITPYADFTIHTERITKENIVPLLEKADIVCEALDDAEEKVMLFEGVRKNFSEKYLVAASGMAGLGSANEIKTHKIGKRLYICGDGKSDVCDHIGPVAPRAALCAAHQAQAVLRILAEEFDV